MLIWTNKKYMRAFLNVFNFPELLFLLYLVYDTLFIMPIYSNVPWSKSKENRTFQKHENSKYVLPLFNFHKHAISYKNFYPSKLEINHYPTMIILFFSKGAFYCYRKFNTVIIITFLIVWIVSQGSYLTRNVCFFTLQRYFVPHIVYL